MQDHNQAKNRRPRRRTTRRIESLRAWIEEARAGNGYGGSTIQQQCLLEYLEEEEANRTRRERLVRFVSGGRKRMFMLGVVAGAIATVLVFVIVGGLI